MPSTRSEAGSWQAAAARVNVASSAVPDERSMVWGAEVEARYVRRGEECAPTVSRGSAAHQLWGFLFALTPNRAGASPALSCTSNVSTRIVALARPSLPSGQGLDAVLHLRTFGGLSLLRGDELVTGVAVQRRRLAVLAVLAVAGDAGTSRDRLLMLFWSEAGEDRGRPALGRTPSAVLRDPGTG